MVAVVGGPHGGYPAGMEHEGADRVHHGEASLGEAQSSNPPDDPEMIEPDAPPLDADTDAEILEDDPPEEPLDNDDPAPNVP
jgi:hypothetical protein